MNNVEVSVFCITYNHEKYIRKTLEGFIMQKTNFVFEVIIHDDASTDKTRAIIDEYRNKYPNIIKPIYEKENQYSKGISFTKKMLDAASGRFIANCEGDDFWVDEHKLQKQYDIMVKNRSVSIVVGKVICCDEGGFPLSRTFPDPSLGIISSGLINKKVIVSIILNYPFHTSSFFTLRTVREKRLSKEFTQYVNGDQSILFESILEGDLYYIDEPLSCRRIGSIGGWNERFKSLAFEKQLLSHLKFLYGVMLLDVELKQEYSTIFFDYTCKILPKCGCIDKNISKKITSHYKMRFYNLAKKSGLKLALFYYFSLFFPWVALKILKKRHLRRN